MRTPIEIYENTKCIGDFRVAANEDRLRLVLLYDASNDFHDTFACYLCTGLIEMATSVDFVYRADETGMPQDILVQTDIVGMIYRSQMGPRIGGLTRDLLDELPYVELTGFGDDGEAIIESREARRIPAGSPLLGEADPRWGWKLGEYDDIRVLATPFWKDFEW